MDKMNEYLRTAQKLLEDADIGTGAAMLALQKLLEDADQEQMKALIEMFESAAANGINSAHRYLAQIYTDGLGGTPINHKKAMQSLYAWIEEITIKGDQS